MPAWIHTPKEEAAWSKAKGIVAKQRKKPQADFKDNDWALVTRITQSILGSKPKVSGSHNGGSDELHFHLANVQHLMHQRRKRGRKEQDQELPAEVQALVQAIGGVASIGDVIGQLRSARQTPLSSTEVAAVVERLQGIAQECRQLLASVSPPEATDGTR
jgi:hypothetical protein